NPCVVQSLGPEVGATPAGDLPLGEVAKSGSFIGDVVSFGPDSAGILQIWRISPTSGWTCLSCSPPGPSVWAVLNKINPLWHPSGQWIVVQGEMPEHPPYTPGHLQLINGQF